MDRVVAGNLNESTRRSGLRRPLRTGLISLLAAVVTAGMVVVAPSAAYAANISIADAKLAACISDELSLPSGTIGFDPSALAAITSLDCSGLGISDLTGIQALTGLTTLDISGNKITDLAPLEHISALPRTGLDASEQVVDWRIKVGTWALLPLNPWFDGDSYNLVWSKSLSHPKPDWKFKAAKTGDYGILVSAVDYKFEVYYNVTAYTIKSFSAPKPKITGTVAVGKTLTAKPGTWKPSTATLSYQWYRSGKTIKGATGLTYTLTKSDLGKKMTMKVTGKQAEYKTATVTSKSTGKVKPGTIVAGAATLSGIAKVGQVITVTTSVAGWSPNTVALSYQWYRSGKAIKGAKAATYTALAADQGKKLSVKVTAKQSGYSTRVVTLNAGVVAAAPLGG